MRRPIGVAIFALAALAASALAAAGTASGTFRVNILLTQPGVGGPASGSGSTVPGGATREGICVSDTLSEQTGALVRVVCANRQFVSISARDDKRFLGTHGGAYDYYFRPAYGVFAIEPGVSAGGTGTITSFRVYSIDEAEGPLHVLVSF